jgi:glutamine---fructose-6-phosphate transaminase (isomerizing)
MSLRDEILEQPAAAERQLGSSQPTIDALVERLRKEPVDSVVIAARGSSDHAAIYAQYLLGTVHRLPVALAAPSIQSLYGVVPRFARSLVIGISQSGASPDIVGVVAAARDQGAPTLAITNDPRSALAGAAEHVIELAAGPELAVAATKTYTTSLLAIARLSAALGSDPTARAELATIPEAIERALAVEPEIEQVARDLASTDRCVVLGRGFEYASAREWALKLKELAQVFADPYSAADFQHGPVALIEPGVPVLAVASEGRASTGLVDLLARLRREVLADVFVLSDSAAIRAEATRAVALPEGVPEWLRPIVSIVPAQLYAYHLTRAKGLDPEVPRNLSKVTLTR